MSSHFSEYVDLSCDDYLIHICRPLINFVHSIMVTAKDMSLDRPARTICTVSFAGLRKSDYKSTSKNPKFGSEITTSWENAQRVAALNKIHLHEKKRPFPRINTSEPTLLATRKDHGRQEKNERIGSIHIMSEKL